MLQWTIVIWKQVGQLVAERFRKQPRKRRMGQFGVFLFKSWWVRSQSICRSLVRSVPMWADMWLSFALLSEISPWNMQKFQLERARRLISC